MNVQFKAVKTVNVGNESYEVVVAKNSNQDTTSIYFKGDGTELTAACMEVMTEDEVDKRIEGFTEALYSSLADLSFYFMSNMELIEKAKAA